MTQRGRLIPREPDLLRSRGPGAQKQSLVLNEQHVELKRRQVNKSLAYLLARFARIIFIVWEIQMDQNEQSEIIQRKQRVSGIFDGAASTYDQAGPRFFSYFGRRLVEIAQIPHQSKVLDVATGRGAVLYPAAQAVGSQGSIIGIDLSEMMIQETSKELVRKRLSPKVEVRLMDAENLQFPDETFDNVLCGFAVFFSFPNFTKRWQNFVVF